MAKAKTLNKDFLKPLYCEKCNKTTQFSIHQYAMIKPLGDKFKNAALGKCNECGHSQALVISGDLKITGTKSKPVKIINPEGAVIGKTVKKTSSEKKSFFQSLFQMFKPKKKLQKKRGR